MMPLRAHGYYRHLLIHHQLDNGLRIIGRRLARLIVLDLETWRLIGRSRLHSHDTRCLSFDDDTLNHTGQSGRGGLISPDRCVLDMATLGELAQQFLMRVHLCFGHGLAYVWGGGQQGDARQG